MLLLSILITFISAYPVANGFGHRGFRFQGLEDPEPASLSRSETVEEKWITQPLDHFNHRDNRTWSMRYLENAGHFIKGGPIFIIIGGEWAISPGYLEGGLMYEIAVDHAGMMYYTEHRYYGESIPTKDSSSENLQYLNIDQALADLAYFIETMKQDENLKDSPVIVFGGSYAGNMAAWSRLKYPHLINGALASSAPVFAKANFYEYLEVVTRSLARYSEQCVADIKQAFETVEKTLTQKGGPEKLKKYFNLCDVPDVKSPSDVGLFTNILAEEFSGIVQYDKVENGKSSIAKSCDIMTALYLGSPLQRLARLVAKNDGKCVLNNYEKFLNVYRNVSWESEAAKSIMRQWTHQTCTEFGYFQTTDSTKSIFGTKFPLNYFVNLCIDLFGDMYNGRFVDSRVRRTNLMYGGRTPDLRNVIFSNGDIDPWHMLSVLEDLNESSPAILIEGSSHCRDLHSDSPTDVVGLIHARAKIRTIMAQWLKTWATNS